MSFGAITGILDSSQIGASLVATYSYAANQAVATVLPVTGVDALSVLTCFAIPLVEFSPTTIMTLPTMQATKTAEGVSLIASGGSIPVIILIFGR